MNHTQIDLVIHFRRQYGIPKGVWENNQAKLTLRFHELLEINKKTGNWLGNWLHLHALPNFKYYSSLVRPSMLFVAAAAHLL